MQLKTIFKYVIQAIFLFIGSSIIYLNYSGFDIGFPFGIYRIGFDCVMVEDPNDFCEGWTWSGVIYDAIFWFTVVFILNKAWRIIKK